MTSVGVKTPGMTAVPLARAWMWQSHFSGQWIMRYWRREFGRW
jgi:hypothetical protein